MDAKRTTAADVARAANVSLMTVSNVVNGRFEAMTDETRAAVEHQIKALDYRPNASGRNLRLKQRFSIGIVIVDESPTFLADPFITHLVAGLSNFLNIRGYALVVQGMSVARLHEATLIRRRETDALCVMLSGPRDTRQRLIKRFSNLGQPIVLFQEPGPPSASVYSIRQDDFGGAKELATHLLHRGFDEVAFLAPSVAWPAIEQRIAGARSAFAAAGSTERFRVIECGDGSIEATDAALSRQLAGSRPPKALMGGNDQLGIGALKWASRRGLSVPGTIGVTGFNAFDAWRYTTPVLTTAASPAYAIGSTAGEVVLDVLHGKKSTAREIVLPVTLQVGEST
jgi:LacI family transcriptional regulator